MSNNIGLKSAKGSSTSGHVQKSWAQNRTNKNVLNYKSRNRNRGKYVVQNGKDEHNSLHKESSLIEHDKKRELQLMISELQDELDDMSSDESQDSSDPLDDEDTTHMRHKKQYEKSVSTGIHKTSAEKTARAPSSESNLKRKLKKQNLIAKITRLKRQITLGKVYQPRDQRLSEDK